MYHSKKIGVFISHIYGPYQSDLCQSIIDKATSYGYLVEIFSSNDGENFGNNKIGESSVLRIPNFDKYSGIIFASGTYPVPELRDSIYKELKEKCTCPIIEVNQINPVFPSVALDNDSTTTQIVQHLITTHEYKRICFLGNSIETAFSQNRYEYYVKSMKANNLIISEHDYYSCSYSAKDIEKAIDFFLEGDKTPDAIICYNDHMALQMILSLTKRGYHIPKDIAITGFDTLEFGQNFNPPLTSVSFPIRELGFATVKNLLKLIDEETIPPVTIVKSQPSIGGTCGCTKVMEGNPFFYSHKLLNQIDSMERFLIEDINMSSILHGMTDLDEGMNLLEKCVNLIDNCKEFYLCLYSNWNSVSSHIRKITYIDDELEDSNTILLKLAIKDGKRLHECSFNSRDSLPDYIYNHSKSAYIYSPLFFNELEFGYIAISYKDNNISYQFNFTSWIMNVNNMLKHICDTKQMGLLVNQLEDLYQKDELTGLNNSSAFHYIAKKMVTKAQKVNESVTIIVLSLDRIRTISENFGYEELNFAIQVVGHALKSALNETYLCAHIVGGTFYVLSKGHDNETTLSFIGKVQKYLKNYNKLQTKKYPISISCGYNSKIADTSFYLQELIENAEKRMYQEKDRKSAENI